MSYIICIFLLALVASSIWIGVLTLHRVFDFSYLSNHNQSERLARALGMAIRQIWLGNNGQWIVFATMTTLAFLIGIGAQFERPSVIAQGAMEIRQGISKSPTAQKALNFLWEGKAQEDTNQEKAELEKEREALYSGTGFAFLPWFTCGCMLLLWTFFYFFYAISDDVAEVARYLSERFGHKQRTGGRAAIRFWPALRHLWYARESSQQSATGQIQTQQNQPSMLAIAGVVLGSHFLFALMEHLWRTLTHKRV